MTTQAMTDTEKMFDWISNNSLFSAWSISSLGSGSDHGVFEGWADLFTEDEPIEVEGLTIQDGRCEFTIGSTSWSLTATKRPSDKWGNEATYHGGLTLVDGCYEVYYGDDSYCELNSDWSSAIESLIADDDFDFDSNEFIDFVLGNYNHLIEVVKEETVCNGTASSWAYWSTNKPVSSNEWQQAIAAFVHSLEE